MNQGYLIDSPLGAIMLRIQDEALTGVFFAGQKYFPDLRQTAVPARVNETAPPGTPAVTKRATPAWDPAVAPELAATISAGAFFPADDPRAWMGAQSSIPIPAIVYRAREQLDQFFSGSLRRFDLPLRMHGSAFQRRVWQALQDIPYGSVVSYGDIARDMGLDINHARAVGAANGRNPISVVVPCHRVVGAGGALTGYAGGLDRKQALLALEKSGSNSPAHSA